MAALDAPVTPAMVEMKRNLVHSSFNTSVESSAGICAARNVSRIRTARSVRPPCTSP